MAISNNQYLVQFYCTFGKVNLIKAIRCFGPYGLKKAKDLVEERYGYDANYYNGERMLVEWLVSDEQLGYYFAKTFGDYPPNITVHQVKPLKSVAIDLTQVDPAAL